MNMRKHNNLVMAEQFFLWFERNPHITVLETKVYYYLFKWAGYRE